MTKRTAFTINSFADCLGNPVSDMLTGAPFKDWTFKKSFDSDLEKPRFDYVFPHHGLDVACDGDEKVTVIFLYADEHRHFDGDLSDLPLSSTRLHVMERLGPPSDSRGRFSDPVLGEYGPGDLFARRGYTIHVEYRPDADRIRMVTLMRAGAVP